ncbi:MAG: M23 family metallopeptidase [Deltaproteobacteria bacterium]|nr:M23 family metallopeptidase [Deltaproteobacteria bacterium]
MAASLGACAPRYRIDDSPMPRLHRERPARAESGLSSWPDSTGREEALCAEPEDEGLAPPGLGEVERAVRFFQTQRRGDGPALDAAWPPFLEIVDAYLDQAPEHLSLSPLIRARVSAEYELDMERRRPDGCPEELERVVGRLLARIDSKVRAMRTLASTAAPRDAASESQGLQWPVAHGMITSGFGYRRDPLDPSRVRFHSGIDLAAPLNEPVMAAASGQVIRTGWAGKAGRAVRIVHPDGTQTMYAHLALILVKPGQRIEAGDVIGLLGASGRATGPHLHFAVFREGKQVDPLDVLRPVPMSFSEDLPGIVFGYGQ